MTIHSCLMRWQGRASVPELRQYFVESPVHARVKVPFVTSSGETEFLWSELLAITDDDMEVRYITPPVTHTGRLERVHRLSNRCAERLGVHEDRRRLPRRVLHAGHVHPWARGLG